MCNVFCCRTVRDNDNNDIGFVADRRRLNVALTRARLALIVVGSSDTLSGNKTGSGGDRNRTRWYWFHFIQYLTDCKAIQHWSNVKPQLRQTEKQHVQSMLLDRPDVKRILTGLRQLSSAVDYQLKSMVQATLDMLQRQGLRELHGQLNKVH